jgi:hypothetical protein
MLDRINDMEDPDYIMWTPKRIIKHTTHVTSNGGSQHPMILVQWRNEEHPTTWVHTEALAYNHPEVTYEYYRSQGMMECPTLRTIFKNVQEIEHAIRVCKAEKVPAKKTKFGVEVPL